MSETPANPAPTPAPVPGPRQRAGEHRRARLSQLAGARDLRPLERALIELFDDHLDQQRRDQSRARWTQALALVIIGAIAVAAMGRDLVVSAPGLSVHTGSANGSTPNP